MTAHVDEGLLLGRVIRIPSVPDRDSSPPCRFDCADATINMAAGECWIFDTWREHNVHNDASHHRIHLVADTVGGETFWSLVEQGARMMRGSPDGRRGCWHRPTPGPLVCEHFNIPRVMSPGSSSST